MVQHNRHPLGSVVGELKANGALRSLTSCLEKSAQSLLYSPEMGCLRFKHFSAVYLLVTSLFIADARSSAAAAAPRSYAVFVAFYNSSNNEARGGVAGTAFFISGTRAITAFHVLQPKSFQGIPGFERVRVWLVHEGEAAIELKPENISCNEERDLTEIQLQGQNQVSQENIFATGKMDISVEAVETEGFVAGSTGPVLVRDGKDLVISSVPKLERLSMVGKVLAQANINMRATDVNLKNSASLQLSYQPVKGMSGGPVLSNGKVIAMNSFADPRTFQQTWALSLQ